MGGNTDLFYITKSDDKHNLCPVVLVNDKNSNGKSEVRLGWYSTYFIGKGGDNENKLKEKRPNDF